jgi:hypothetical protein
LLPLPSLPLIFCPPCCESVLIGLLLGLCCFRFGHIQSAYTFGDTMSSITDITRGRSNSAKRHIAEGKKFCKIIFPKSPLFLRDLEPNLTPCRLGGKPAYYVKMSSMGSAVFAQFTIMSKNSPIFPKTPLFGGSGPKSNTMWLGSRHGCDAKMGRSVHPFLHKSRL